MKKGKGFGDDFIKNLLLTLEETNFDEFMNFEESEAYEKCTNLQKLKHLLFLEADEGDS